MNGIGSIDLKASDIKILLADDDEDILEYYASLLIQENYLVETAVDGRDALEKAKNKKYDFILTDFKMPNLSGIELISHIKTDSLNRETPCAVLSGALDEPACNRFRQLKVAEIIDKPIDPQNLIEIIRLNTYSEDQHEIQEIHPNIITAFEKSLLTTFSAFCRENPVIEPPKQHSAITRSLFCTSTLGVFGNSFNGSVSLTLSEKLLRHILNLTFQGLPVDPIEDHAEIVCEFLNQVGAELKKNFKTLGISIDVGLPVHFRLDSHPIEHFVSGNTTQIDFASDGHLGSLQFCLAAATHKAEDRSSPDFPLFVKIAA